MIVCQLVQERNVRYCYCRETKGFHDLQNCEVGQVRNAEKKIISSRATQQRSQGRTRLDSGMGQPRENHRTLDLAG